MTCEYLSTHNKKPCDYYIKSGFCTRFDKFKCEEYMTRYEFPISFSSMKLFERCPQAYYLSQITGIEKINKSDQLKIGIYVDGILSGKTKAEMAIKGIFQDSNLEDNILWLSKAKAIIDGMRFYELDIPLKQYVAQKEFILNEDGIPKLHGFIDFAAEDHFLELKVTGNSGYYKDKFSIEEQIGTYFLTNKNYKYCTMLIVEVPDLKKTKGGEDTGKYYNRCLKDIISRPYFYFGENFNAREKTFGIKFYRNEFNEERLIKKYKWICDEIKKCINENYWMQRRSACSCPFICDFKSVCDLDGKISMDIYRYKEKREVSSDTQKSEGNINAKVH